MSMKSLEDAFHDELRDVLSAEKQITKALRKMSKRASDENLSNAFDEHLEQTEGQIERLEQVFESIGKKARAKQCEAMNGLIEEGKEIMEEDAEPEVMDAMLIAAAQKVEHYEIATYGTLVNWARTLGLIEAVKLLEETLNEEKETDQKLNALAEKINQAAQPTAS